MKKLLHSVLFCGALAASLFVFTLFSDRQALQQELIRLHVVADSDEPEDQAVKLKVRDAVLESIREGMESAASAEEAKQYLTDNLPKIQKAANDTLKALGCEDCALVSLCKEAFDKRVYDTFSLPSGIYEALRITIGDGEGHNWWCVAFPTLCVPAVSEGMEAVAADAGLSQSLRGAMTGRYELRFYLLDLLGRLQTQGKNGSVR